MRPIVELAAQRTASRSSRTARSRWARASTARTSACSATSAASRSIRSSTSRRARAACSSAGDADLVASRREAARLRRRPHACRAHVDPRRLRRADARPQLPDERDAGGARPRADAPRSPRSSRVRGGELRGAATTALAGDRRRPRPRRTEPRPTNSHYCLRLGARGPLAATGATRSCARLNARGRRHERLLSAAGSAHGVLPRASTATTPRGFRMRGDQRRTIALPVGPHLTEDDVEYIGDACVARVGSERRNQRVPIDRHDGSRSSAAPGSSATTWRSS